MDFAIGRREWLCGIAGTMAWGCRPWSGSTKNLAGIGGAWVDGSEPIAPERMLDALPAPLAGWSIGYETGRYHHHAGGRILATTAVRVYRRGLDRIWAHWLDHVHLAEPWLFDPAFNGLARWGGAVDLEFVDEQGTGVLLANLKGRFALRIEGNAGSGDELREWYLGVRTWRLTNTD